MLNTTDESETLIEMVEEIHVSSRDEWRDWLRENHDSKKEVWLIYYKKGAGKTSIAYEDSVEEALCFGWIDSIVKKLDYEKFVRKFTPRKNKSVWSESNKKRVEKMIKYGKMTDAGLAKIEEAKESGEWFRPPVSAAYKRRLVIPSYFEKALAANGRALKNFNGLAESYRKNIVGWVDSAKKEETRRRRLREAIKLLERNQKLGLK